MWNQEPESVQNSRQAVYSLKILISFSKGTKYIPTFSSAFGLKLRFDRNVSKKLRL